MKWNRMGVHIVGEYLTGMTLLHAIFEDHGPKLSSAQSFLENNQTREMTVICFGMKVIQNFLGFLISKEMM
jgi:hypothetical protein